jgi:selT/selW/selH-like putative selenoprotein
LAAELKKAFPEAEVRLVESSGGIFDVAVDGAVIFSKKAAGRQAGPGEVLDLIRKSEPRP